MSRIGKLPIKVPTGVTVSVSGQEVEVKGPKGSLKRIVHEGIEAKIENDEVIVSMPKAKDSLKPFFGTERALLANMVKGVSEGWSKQLELVGTGYRAETSGKSLTLTVGYSHSVKVDAPEGVSFKVEKNVVTVEGSDREAVGHVSALVRAVRPPEPYKGKGIKYINEVIRRKAGKAAKTAVA